MEKIFKNIFDYSLKLERGESVFIFADIESREYTLKLCEELLSNGNIPYLVWNDVDLNKLMIRANDSEIDSELYDIVEKSIEKCDAAIMLDNNIEDYKNFDSNDVIKFKNNYYLKIFQKIMNFERWVYLRYPNKALAKLFKLSPKKLERLLFDVNNFDYKKLSSKAQILKNFLDKTSYIRILGKETDISFQKKNVNTVVCCGNINLPDGEVYTAPEKFSVNGKIMFDVDSYFRGNTYKNLKLFVKDGKIVDYDCNLNEEFGKILNSDEGASYFGEFAFGLNPFIDRNYNDNLFNEKMARTIHMAIGRCHPDTNNENNSIIHWDLIKIMKQDCQIYFDDNLVYENGEFVIDDLKNLYEV